MKAKGIQKLGIKHSKAKPKKKTKLIFQEWERKELDLESKNGERDCLMEFKDLQYDNFYKGLFGKRRPIIIKKKVIKQMQGRFK